MFAWWVPECARLVGKYGLLIHFAAPTPTFLTPGQLPYKMKWKVGTGTHPEKTQMELSTLPLDLKPSLFLLSLEKRKRNVSSSHGWKALDKKRMLHSTVGDHVVCPGELL